jgi:hypothetical protein
MSINWVRGFRRIGWVLTAPVAAFVVLLCYEWTKEFSAADYEAAQTRVVWDDDVLAGHVKSIVWPDLGIAYFSGEVPGDMMETILDDFKAKRAALKLSASSTPTEGHAPTIPNPLRPSMRP